MPRTTTVNGRTQSVNGRTVGGTDIPDSVAMFDNPIYDWFAGAYDGSEGDQPVAYPERLAGLSDATAVNTPSFDADYDGTGYSAIGYDSSEPDYHQYSADDNLPTGSDAKLSIFSAYYTTTNSQNQHISGYGSDDLGLTLRSSGSYGIQTRPHKDVNGGSYPTGSIDTTGFTYDVASGDVVVYGGGSSVATGSTSATLDDTGRYHGYDATANSHAFEGGILEIVYCNTIESLSNYQSFHNYWTA